jgi:hypothetical protein
MSKIASMITASFFVLLLSVATLPAQSSQRPQEKTEWIADTLKEGSLGLLPEWACHGLSTHSTGARIARLSLRTWMDSALRARPVNSGVMRLSHVLQVMPGITYKDAAGERLKVGDTVRVLGVPDLSGMSSACLAESLPVFQHLVGKYKRVREWDEHGLAWLQFRIRKGPHAGLHSVGIEPWLLKRRQARKKNDSASRAA